MCTTRPSTNRRHRESASSLCGFWKKPAGMWRPSEEASVKIRPSIAASEATFKSSQFRRAVLEMDGVSRGIAEPRIGCSCWGSELWDRKTSALTLEREGRGPSHFMMWAVESKSDERSGDWRKGRQKELGWSRFEGSV
jgi:hypothetical protein